MILSMYIIGGSPKLVVFLCLFFCLRDLLKNLSIVFWLINVYRPFKIDEHSLIDCFVEYMILFSNHSQYDFKY